MRICASIAEFEAEWEVGTTLGSGGYAVVKRCRSKATGSWHAVKVVDKTSYAPGDQSLAREVAVLQTVRHPNCLQMEEVYVTPRHVLVVTELADGGELHNELVQRGCIPEAEAAWLTRQIMEGVHYLHSQGIVHRDIKLENVLFSSMGAGGDGGKARRVLKLCDFGLSKVFGTGEQLETMCGSPQYVAPEILAIATGELAQYTPAVDVWSVGVLVYILLCGYSPFDVEDDTGAAQDGDAALFQRIRGGQYSLDEPEWHDVSAEAKDVVRGLLSLDPHARWTAKQALAHPWIARSGPC